MQMPLNDEPELSQDEEFEEEKVLIGDQDGGYSYYVRQSIFILIIRLILGEAFIGLLFFLVRFPVITNTEPLNFYYLSGIAYALVVAAIQIANIIIILYINLTWLRTTYTVRQKDIIVHRGIIHVTEVEYSTERIETVNVDQGIIGRIFNYGSVRVFNPVLKEDVVLENIPSPYLYAAVIANHQPKEVVRFFPQRKP